ncbi:MAG: carotenoid 1,2-hydratase [SAR324 cluster bacterium]|nr:carotenoid 1,2-hydratase [SAR324 cluster bacterium]
MSPGKYFFLFILFIFSCPAIDWIPLAEALDKIVISESKKPLSVSSVLGETTDESFEKVLKPRHFKFPEDHGPHPAFQNEWWYFTGNLMTDSGRKFGYQLTLFRNSLSAKTLRSSSSWKTNQIMMGHFALTDIQQQKHHSFERFSRIALGLAGAQARPFRVWIEGWEVQGAAGENLAVTLSASQDELSLQLSLVNTKPLVLQGNQGFSQKGSQAGNASYYYSYTRLASSGTVQIDSERFEVQGWSWMDREWSTSALEKNQVGWDWFALQLETGQELMYYQLRQKDGKPSPQSSGVWVPQNGTPVKLSDDKVVIEVLNTWRSPSNKVYPIKWRLQEKSLGIDLVITPYVRNQEMTTSFLYWEGAVKVQGQQMKKSLQGRGYVEMTGY